MRILEHITTERGEFFILSHDPLLKLKKGDPFTDGKAQYTITGIEPIRGMPYSQEKIGIQVERMSSDPKEVKLGDQDWTDHPAPSTGYACIEVLPFLKGWHINEPLVRAYVHSLRPSVVRVCRGGAQMNAQTWRVTIHLDNGDFINRIDQEVEVNLGSSFRNGHELACNLKGIKPLQPDGDGNYCIGNIEGIKNIKFK